MIWSIGTVERLKISKSGYKVYFVDNGYTACEPQPRVKQSRAQSGARMLGFAGHTYQVEAGLNYPSQLEANQRIGWVGPACTPPADGCLQLGGCGGFQQHSGVLTASAHWVKPQRVPAPQPPKWAVGRRMGENIDRICVPVLWVT